MTNALTGDYEAVVQIGVSQINGLLATLHQNGVADDAPLKLLHSTSLRIGDARRVPPDVSAVGDWLTMYRSVGGADGISDLGSHLTSTAPPGVAKRLADA